ncbi:hypothetical protein I350_00090 [Cryptococcus amylolentus CBS 6273]|uniref:Uncharacterized protein n=1 Tax=Cryptococcus amylolentus CBS 6273 TaxID=1296118 RepID=A0A1E3KDY5_9TREE|nr:hypothetical protein I350_00090 [Cryptococcus amylolentus CBS 6273]
MASTPQIPHHDKLGSPGWWPELESTLRSMIASKVAEAFRELDHIHAHPVPGQGDVDERGTVYKAERLDWHVFANQTRSDYFSTVQGVWIALGSELLLMYILPTLMTSILVYTKDSILKAFAFGSTIVSLLMSYACRRYYQAHRINSDVKVLRKLRSRGIMYQRLRLVGLSHPMCEMSLVPLIAYSLTIVSTLFEPLMRNYLIRSNTFPLHDDPTNYSPTLMAVIHMFALLGYCLADIFGLTQLEASDDETCCKGNSKGVGCYEETASDVGELSGRARHMEKSHEIV